MRHTLSSECASVTGGQNDASRVAADPDYDFGERRIRYADTIPYETPSALSALRGSALGTLTLPITVHWGPERRVDLETPHGIAKAYRVLVREGTSAQQEEYLNARVLRQLWSELVLPVRCRALWEQRFPELMSKQ